MDPAIERFLFGLLAAILLIVPAWLMVTNIGYIESLMPGEIGFILLLVFPLLFLASYQLFIGKLVLGYSRSVGFVLIAQVLLIVGFLVMLAALLSQYSWFSSSVLDALLGDVLFTAPLLLSLAVAASLMFVYTNRNLLLLLALIFLICILIVSYSIGSISSDIFASMKGAALVFMVFPAIIHLFLIISLFSPRTSNLSEAEIAGIYLLYPLFSFIGSVLGALGFYVAGFMG